LPAINSYARFRSSARNSFHSVKTLSANRLTEIGNLVDESHLHGQEGAGGVSSADSGLTKTIGALRSISISAAHWCSDGNEHEIGLPHSRRENGRKLEPSGICIPLKQGIESWFVDRYLAGSQPGNLIDILVDARYCPAEFSKAGG
jgi:hypothetical protein